MFCFKKIHGNFMISANFLERWYFKKISQEYDLSCIIRKDDISLSQKYDVFPKAENKRSYFSKNFMEI